MNSPQTWPDAGISVSDENIGRVRATAPLRVCAGTPSLIETEDGEIVAQVFERYDPLLNEKQRLAEMWARALRIVEVLNAARGVAIPLEGRDAEAA